MMMKMATLFQDDNIIYTDASLTYGPQFTNVDVIKEMNIHPYTYSMRTLSRLRADNPTLHQLRGYYLHEIN